MAQILRFALGFDPDSQGSAHAKWHYALSTSIDLICNIPLLPSHSSLVTRKISFLNIEIHDQNYRITTNSPEPTASEAVSSHLAIVLNRLSASCDKQLKPPSIDGPKASPLADLAVVNCADALLPSTGVTMPASDNPGLY